MESDIMTYSDLIEILISDDVYNGLKQNKEDIFLLIPELKICNGFNQNNKWHIYDVFEHILHVVSGVNNNLCLRLAALFHDIGKPQTYTEDENGVGHFYNHWNISLEIFKKYKDNFGLSFDEIILITNLIFYHDINIEKASQSQINDMINKIGYDNLWMLFSLKRADLLAQSSEFHWLISSIDNQEQSLIRTRIKKDE